MLPQAPPRPLVDAAPAFGTYAGRCEDTDLQLADRGVGRLRRAVSEKRWQWFTAFDDDYAVGGAVVDAGVVGTAFLWVFDRAQRRFLVDADVLAPSTLVRVAAEPAGGCVARVGLPRRRLQVTRSGDAVAIVGSVAGVDVSLAADASGGEAVTAIAPVAGRDAGVNVTHKETGVAVAGRLGVDGGRDFRGVGMLDYSHGLLARETAWEWAVASGATDDGRPVGFNLVAGFNDGLENAVWVDGTPRSVGDASFERPAGSSEGDWRVRTDCGTVDVELAVEGSRDEDVDVGLLASRYHQPLGRWSGTVAGRSFEGAGVAERHRARW